MLGTYRIVEVNLGEHHLKQVMQELQLHGQCEELALDFLSEAAVGDYLARRFGQAKLPDGLPGFIHRHTDGNPLFVVRVTEDLVQRELLTEHEGQWELSGGLSEESIHVPEGLRQFIEQQFVQLSGAERSLVEAASVAGVEFSAAAVAAGIQQTVEEVEIVYAGLAQRQHFLVDKGVAEWPDGTVAVRYGFIHALYQEVLYARLTPGRRSGLYQRIGQRTEAAYGARADDIAAESALHFERGRDFPRPIQYWQKAGQRALQRSANVEAIGHFTKGLELLNARPDAAVTQSTQRAEPGAEAQRCQLLLALGEAQLKVGEYVAAQETLLRAADTARELGATESLVRSALMLARLTEQVGLSAVPAVGLLEEALQRLGTTDRLLRAQTLGGLARVLGVTGEHQPARQYAQQAAALARDLDDPELLAANLEGMIHALQGEHPQQRLAYATEMRSLPRPHGPKSW